ncbi:hypothetical protein [Saccharibacillus sacchari]|uniref:Uncharacterized protein n=1 Tax=Saccharibacillus sacchari TaxID=456493 RepID=A0ACC6PEZ6_9BACL
MNRAVHKQGPEYARKDSAEAGLSLSEKRSTLQHVTLLLERAGVDYVVGGSGMLLGLGLTDNVRDWDLMTDAPEAEVREALAGMELVEENGSSELYGSGRKLRIEKTNPEVEIIIGFAIRFDGQNCRMPALTAGVRDGLRIASPEVWMAAYALMGRTEKANLLEGYLQQNGADRQAVARILEEPLPAELSEKLKRLPLIPKQG